MNNKSIAEDLEDKAMTGHRLLRLERSVKSEVSVIIGSKNSE